MRRGVHPPYWGMVRRSQGAHPVLLGHHGHGKTLHAQIPGALNPARLRRVLPICMAQGADRQVVRGRARGRTPPPFWPDGGPCGAGRRRGAAANRWTRPTPGRFRGPAGLDLGLLRRAPTKSACPASKGGRGPPGRPSARKQAGTPATTHSPARDWIDFVGAPAFYAGSLDPAPAGRVWCPGDPRIVPEEGSGSFSKGEFA
jgi:hypothetical protein